MLSARALQVTQDHLGCMAFANRPEECALFLSRQTVPRLGTEGRAKIAGPMLAMEPCSAVMPQGIRLWTPHDQRRMASIHQQQASLPSLLLPIPLAAIVASSPLLSAPRPKGRAFLLSCGVEVGTTAYLRVPCCLPSATLKCPRRAITTDGRAGGWGVAFV